MTLNSAATFAVIGEVFGESETDGRKTEVRPVDPIQEDVIGSRSTSLWLGVLTEPSFLAVNFLPILPPEPLPTRRLAGITHTLRLSLLTVDAAVAASPASWFQGGTYFA